MACHPWVNYSPALYTRYATRSIPAQSHSLRKHPNRYTITRNQDGQEEANQGEGQVMADKHLTPKMQGFVDGRAEGMAQSDAYRAAYDAENMSPKQIWEEASKLAALPKVAQRLFELQEASAERTLVTMESITAELEEARAMADRLEQSSAMTAASMEKQSEAEMVAANAPKSRNILKATMDKLDALQGKYDRLLGRYEHTVDRYGEVVDKYCTLMEKVNAKWADEIDGDDKGKMVEFETLSHNVHIPDREPVGTISNG